MARKTARRPNTRSKRRTRSSAGTQATVTGHRPAVLTTTADRGARVCVLVADNVALR